MLDGTRAAGSTPARLWLTLLDIEGCQPVSPVWRVLFTLLDPISVAVHVGSSFQHYSHGVFSDPSCRYGQLNHAVLLVGYNKSGSQHSWIVKNPWGSGGG